MFSSWFWKISFKEAKRRSEERYRFMLSEFLFILMVLYKLLFSCHRTVMKATKTLCVQNYPTQEEIKHCWAITLFLKMLQDFMAAAKTCRPQITAKGICRRTCHAQTYLTSAVKPLRTFLSLKDFNLSPHRLAPFFNFMTACYSSCLHVT